MKMRHLALTVLLSSCSLMFGGGGPPSAKDKDYKISFKESGWKAVKGDDRSDYVFQHDDGRILLSNSFCGEFQDQPLDHLARKTFRTIGNFTPETSDWAMLKSREAYRLEGKGNVDGVSVGLQLLNTRRNNCYFDFVGITPLSLPNSDQSLFDRFLGAVEFK